MKDAVVLRLEVDYMKHSMLQAISAHHLQIQERIKIACDNFLASGELDKIISEHMTKAVSDELRNFFSYGDGRKAIQGAVSQGLKTHFKKKTG